MIYLVISCSLFAFFLVSILLSPIGRKIDIKNKRLDLVSVSKKTVYSELDLSIYIRIIAPKIDKIKRIISKLGKRFIKNNKKQSSSAALENSLRLAGIRMTPEEFSVIKLIIVFIMVFISLILYFIIRVDIGIKSLIFISGVMLSILIPQYYLKSKIATRQNSIKQQLPEVMDLLCVSLEAGLSFDSSILKISEKMEGDLIDELLILNREIQMGKPRREALKDFGECSPVPELKAFASAIIQAEQLGIAIKNVLKTQSAQLRIARRQAAQEKGMKSPIKMMLPMVVFIFPVIFIILLGPTVIQVIGQFSK